MSDKEISVLVLEVRNELVKRGYVITPTFTKVKGDWRVRITVTQGGSSVQKKVFETALQMAGWSLGQDPFIHVLSTILSQERAKTEKVEKSQKDDDTPSQSAINLTAYTIAHPDIHDRRRYTKADLEMLSIIRLVSKDGRLALVKTGESDTGTGSTYKTVSLGLGFASSLRSVLREAPAKHAWKENQLKKALVEKRNEVIALLRAETEETRSELSSEELEEEASRKVEEARGEIEKEIEKLTLFDQCNDGLSRLLSRCSARIYGSEGAWDAFVAYMRSNQFPLLFCRSKKLQAWYRRESVRTNEGTMTITYAERFSYDGDYADIVADNLEYLWGVRELAVQMPVAYTNDPTVPCFNFFDIEKAKQATGEYPAWDEFTSRLTDEETKAFKAFVWSIFDASNRGRQCLYILDKGYSGKSAIVNAISNAIGADLHAALSKESLCNQFAYSKVWDKRFVTIGDNKNPNLVRSQAMHSMLGGDIVDVEYKGKDPFSARLMCKVFVASNVPLQIDVKARNEVTRVLPIHPDDSVETLVKRGLVAVNDDGTPKLTATGDPITIGDPDWESKLKEQFPAFLASCFPVYKEICPRGMDIMVPEKSSEILASFDDDRAALFDEILEKNFDLSDRDAFMSRAEMQRAFTEAIRDDSTYSDAKLSYAEWKEFLRRRHSIESVRKRSDGGRLWGYYGLSQKKIDTDEY